MTNQLLLASSSCTRQELLRQAQIPYTVIDQNADESLCNHQGSLAQCVTRIAEYKMDHVTIQSEVTGDAVFILTADTLGMDARGTIHSKPTDYQDAIAKIKALRGTGVVGTAFCIEKRENQKGTWLPQQRVSRYIEASYVFDMPDVWIEKYLAAVPSYYTMSGAITIEGYGAQFLKSINGSYSTILGLPLFEVREALEKIGFFS